MQSAWTRGQKDSEGAGAPARKVNYMVSAEAPPVTFSAVQGDRWSKLDNILVLFKLVALHVGRFLC